MTGQSIGLQQILIVVHVLAALSSIGLGIVAMRSKKGDKNHRRVGKAYFWLMMLTCLSASLLLIYRFTFFLTAITVLSAYTAFTGYRVLWRKSGQYGTVLDWVATIVATLAGFSFVVWGIALLTGQLSADIPAAFGGLGIAFGAMLLANARPDIQAYRNPPTDKRWWLFYHIDRMLGSFIALITAFSVQIADEVIPEEMRWLFWIAPGVIGTVLAARYVRNYRAQLEAVGDRYPKGRAK